jgi:hypothetical protein
MMADPVIRDPSNINLASPQVQPDVSTSKSDLVNLTFSSQNCNSLNISTSCPKQMKKMAAILALQTTFIFLSDIRLNTGTTGGHSNMFAPHYTLYHNSTRSKRGVGILISNKLQYTVLQSFTDNNDNILGLKLQIGRCTILIVSVYGPNQNNDCFFTDLDFILGKNKDIYKLCAGDWNLTYSTEPSPYNIDIINMQAPPSLSRSSQLAAICDEYELVVALPVCNLTYYLTITY